MPFRKVFGQTGCVNTLAPSTLEYVMSSADAPPGGFNPARFLTLLAISTIASHEIPGQQRVADVLSSATVLDRDGATGDASLTVFVNLHRLVLPLALK